MSSFEGAQVDHASNTDEQTQVWQGADLVCRYLEQIGVEYVYGIPGGAIEPLFNALARSERRNGLKAVVSRHETGAAFMASGYTSQTGKLGVCCATTGPGATNLITGVASAYANNTPMLVITAQSSLKTFGRGAFQESTVTGVNTVGMYEHCTRYNVMVTHIEQLETQFVNAVMRAFQQPRGPVHLSIPSDIFSQQVTRKKTLYNIKKYIGTPSLVDEMAFLSLVHHLAKAKKPVILVGGGCAEAMSAILDLALLLNISVVATAQAKGLISAYHPKFKGISGFAGHTSAYQTLIDPEVDLVLAAGTGLGEWSSSVWDEGLILNERLIHIDEVEQHMARSPMAKLHVRGRIVTIFEKLLELRKAQRAYKYPSLHKLKALNYGENQKQLLLSEDDLVSFYLSDNEKYFSDEIPIKPQRLMREFSRMFPSSARYVVDTGNSMAWATHYLFPKDRRIKGKRIGHDCVVRSNIEFSSMGWAIGHAIGVSMGERRYPVVCVTGDGSFLMFGTELTVAVEESLNIVFVVLNDASLGMVKHGQKLSKAESIGHQLPKLDYALLAKAYGLRSYVIEAPDDLACFFDDWQSKPTQPVLLDVRIDGQEVPPIGVRTKALKLVPMVAEL